jgi:hypothetical protein
VDDPRIMARRRWLRTVLAGAASALIVRRGDPAYAQQKLSQHDAEYQDEPKDHHTCGVCTLFQPPKSCKVVDGDISPHGWCKLFDESPE